MIQSKCRSCGAPVLWLKTMRGKTMPVDAEPHPAGTIDVHEGVAYMVPGDVPVPGRPLYRSHFVTCPEAARWRKST
jgi:hypothetical protein